MEEFVVNQIKYGLRHIPPNLLKSYAVPKRSAESESLRRRGFVRGVCHPDENYALLREAHIESRQAPQHGSAVGGVYERQIGLQLFARQFTRRLHPDDVSAQPEVGGRRLHIQSAPRFRFFGFVHDLQLFSMILHLFLCLLYGRIIWFIADIRDITVFSIL